MIRDRGRSPLRPLRLLDLRGRSISFGKALFAPGIVALDEARGQVFRSAVPADFRALVTLAGFAAFGARAVASPSSARRSFHRRHAPASSTAASTLTGALAMPFFKLRGLWRGFAWMRGADRRQRIGNLRLASGAVRHRSRAGNIRERKNADQLPSGVHHRKTTDAMFAHDLLRLQKIVAGATC